MSAPPFKLVYLPSVRETVGELKKKNQAKYKKVQNCLKRLRDNGPAHPSLASHQYNSLTGPGGEKIWESYAENHTPNAWRVWWFYGPGEDTLTIFAVGGHP